MRQLDPDSNKSVELNNVNYEQIDEEIRQSQSQADDVMASKDGSPQKGVTMSRSGRRRVPVAAPMELPEEEDDYEDSEEDESFQDAGPGSENSDDDEDGEEEMEDDD